jgi:hypothetical protein
VHTQRGPSIEEEEEEEEEEDEEDGGGEGGGEEEEEEGGGGGEGGGEEDDDIASHHPHPTEHFSVLIEAEQIHLLERWFVAGFVNLAEAYLQVVDPESGCLTVLA